MDIGRLYGSYFPSAAGQTAAARSAQSGSSFHKDVSDLMTNRAIAYGKSSRPKLTDGEVRELGRKYDFRNMTQEAYDAFLDDLVRRGVLAKDEAGYFGYGGEVRKEAVDGRLLVMRIDGLDERYTRHTPFLEGGGPGSGNMAAWLAQMMTECEGGDGTREGAKRVQQRMEMYGALIDVVYRATGASVEDALRAQYARFTVTADSDGVADQLADPGSGFYQDMFQRMRLQWEESEEEKKQQAIIDALDGILEGMRAADGARREKAFSAARLSRQISGLDADGPRRAQLDLFRRQMNRPGVFTDLGRGGSVRQTLTRRLAGDGQENRNFSISDLI